MLLQCRFTGFKLEIPISCSNLTTHVTSETTLAIARYSASELDLATIGYILNFQLMGEVPSIRMKPDTPSRITTSTPIRVLECL